MVITLTIKSMDSVCTYGLMEELTSVTGLKVNKLMKEFIFYQTEPSEKVFGKMAKEENGLPS